MTTDTIEITEDEFDSTYSLRPNHLNPDATWATGFGPGCLFDPSPEELDFVRRQDPRTVWTLLDGDDGHLYIVSGYHFVNRIGYLISAIPFPADRSIQVRIPMNSETTEGDRP
jgi:hypothetical protein